MQKNRKVPLSSLRGQSAGSDTPSLSKGEGLVSDVGEKEIYPKSQLSAQDDTIDAMGDFNFLDDEPAEAIEPSEDEIYLSSSRRKKTTVANQIKSLNQTSQTEVDKGIFVKHKPDASRALPEKAADQDYEIEAFGKTYVIPRHSRLSKAHWESALKASTDHAVFEYYGPEHSFLFQAPRTALPGAVADIFHASLMVKNGHCDDWEPLGYQHCLADMSGGRVLIVKKDSPEMDLFGGSLLQVEFKEKNVSKPVQYNDPIPD